MPIFYEDSSINNAILDEESLSLVNCNGIQVFPDAIYQFPCDTAYFPTTNTKQYGFNVKFDGQVSEHLAKYAFDNTTDKDYCYFGSSGYYAQNIMNKGNIAILFPFYICVQSVTIINATSNYKSKGYGGLKQGTINLVEPLPEGSTNTKFLNQISSGIDSDYFVKYVDFDRGTDEEVIQSGYSTTHSNPEMSNTRTRWVVINSSSWNSTNYHRIGDIRIKFKADQSDIKAWNDTYSSDNMQFIPIIG